MVKMDFYLDFFDGESEWIKRLDKFDGEYGHQIRNFPMVKEVNLDVIFTTPSGKSAFEVQVTVMVTLGNSG